ncbi:MAG: hypothetical protein JWP01_636 [Myxococcales bacterium]|nr:hypothetical protein [Myxococcales bacterium]
MPRERSADPDLDAEELGDEDVEQSLDKDEWSLHFETARTVAFSDAVLAIVITLLVIDLRPPHLAPGQSLASALLADYQRYVALVSSFAIIGLVWIHHHRLFRLIERADHRLVNLNLLLLLVVMVVPYPTALLAAFPQDRAAAVLYTSVVALIALLFNVLWHHVRHRPWLLRPGLDPIVLKTIDLHYLVGFGAYVLIVAISFVSIPASIVGNILLAIYFALPLHVVKRHLLERRASRFLDKGDGRQRSGARS